VLAVDPEAVSLHVAAILWSGDQLTDGDVSAGAATMLGGLARIRRPARAIGQLVEVGLLVPDGSGWHVHDFEVINRQATRSVVEAEREAWAERQSRARSRRASRNGHGVSPPDDTTRHDT